MIPLTVSSLRWDRRPGYGNGDSWYAGQAHAWTMVDSPRAGTLRTAQEIEAISRKVGGLGA